MDPELINIADDASAHAARVLRDAYRQDAGVESSNAKDIKTAADREAEKLIRKRLASTGIPILGEEQGGEVSFEDRIWVVDPLDGTMNFTRGYPEYCVSLGLWENGTPVFGAIRSVDSGALLIGGQALLPLFGGKPVRVSEVPDVGQAILATGFPSGRDYGSDALMDFVSRVQQFKKIRMIGSAAMAISYVARGVFDAYTEESIYFWDVAAGIALVKAAGGRVLMTPPNTHWQMNVWADNGRLPDPPEWPGAIDV